MEHHRPRIISGDVSEPFDVAAGEVPRILRDQSLDAVLFHVPADQLPTPFEFVNRDSRESMVVAVSRLRPSRCHGLAF